MCVSEPDLHGCILPLHSQPNHCASKPFIVLSRQKLCLSRLGWVPSLAQTSWLSEARALSMGPYDAVWRVLAACGHPLPPRPERRRNRAREARIRGPPRPTRFFDFRQAVDSHQTGCPAVGPGPRRERPKNNRGVCCNRVQYVACTHCQSYRGGARRAPAAVRFEGGATRPRP